MESLNELSHEGQEVLPEAVIEVYTPEYNRITIGCSSITHSITEDIELFAKYGIKINPKAIGKGCTSTVYRGQFEAPESTDAMGAPIGDVLRGMAFGKPFAVKFIDYNMSDNSWEANKEREELVKEKYILSELKHPNIVSILMAMNMGRPMVRQYSKNATKSYLCHERLYLVMELAQIGSLKDCLDANEAHGLKMPEQLCIKFVKELYSGLRCLHEKRITHGSLHTENVLMFNAGKDKRPVFSLKIIDFGYSHVFDGRHHSCEELTQNEIHWKVKSDIENLAFMLGSILNVSTCSRQGLIVERIVHELGNSCTALDDKRMSDMIDSLCVDIPPEGVPKEVRPSTSGERRHEVLPEGVIEVYDPEYSWLTMDPFYRTHTVDEDMRLLADNGIKITSQAVGKGCKSIVFKGYFEQRLKPMVKAEHPEVVIKSFAVKYINHDLSDTSFEATYNREAFDREKYVLNRLKHPNIVHILVAINLGNSKTMAFNTNGNAFYGCAERVYLFIDLAHFGSLKDFIAGLKAKRKTFGECECIRFVVELHSALKYLHGMSITHNSVHIGNVLVFNEGSDDEPVLTLKLADFGNSHVFDGGHHSCAVLSQEQIDAKIISDITRLSTIYGIIYQNSTFERQSTDRSVQAIMGELDSRVISLDDQRMDQMINDLFNRIQTSVPTAVPQQTTQASGVVSRTTGARSKVRVYDPQTAQGGQRTYVGRYRPGKGQEWRPMSTIEEESEPEDEVE